MSISVSRDGLCVLLTSQPGAPASAAVTAGTRRSSSPGCFLFATPALKNVPGTNCLLCALSFLHACHESTLPAVWLDSRDHSRYFVDFTFSNEIIQKHFISQVPEMRRNHYGSWEGAAFPLAACMTPTGFPRTGRREVPSFTSRGGRWSGDRGRVACWGLLLHPFCVLILDYLGDGFIAPVPSLSPEFRHLHSKAPGVVLPWSQPFSPTFRDSSLALSLNLPAVFGIPVSGLQFPQLSGTSLWVTSDSSPLAPQSRPPLLSNLLSLCPCCPQVTPLFSLSRGFRSRTPSRL